MKRNSGHIIPALPEVKLSEAIKAIKNGRAGSWPRRSVLVATKTLFRMPRSKLTMVRQYGSTLRIAAIAVHSEDFTLTNPVTAWGFPEQLKCEGPRIHALDYKNWPAGCRID